MRKRMAGLLPLLLALLLSGWTCPASATAEDAAEAAAPVKLVEASYDIRQTPKFASKEATLRVYSDGTSEMTMVFVNAGGYRFDMPEDAFIRLIKADGVEGNFGQAPLVLTGENNSAKSQFSAVIPLDRAFGKTGFMTFAICRPDGKVLQQLKYNLVEFDSADGKWPAPESTPAVPTIPPVSPTPTPTPRPTLVPGTTEPPRDSAVLTVKYTLREFTNSFTEKEAILRIYEDMSALTVRFVYDKEIEAGSVMRMTMANGRLGFYGEGLISAPDAQGVREATIFFNQQVGPTGYINLEAYAPGSQVRSFKAFYKPPRYDPEGWAKMKPVVTVPPVPTATPAPLPEGASPTPAPTEPPRSAMTSQTPYNLLDPVKYFSLKSASHRRYEGGVSVLMIQFRYTGELPAEAVLRIVQREYSEGNFGEARIERGEDDLLTATIVTDQLQGSLRAFRLKCYDEENREQFYADFSVSLGSALWNDGPEAAMARSMLPTPTPEPVETPVPTPTVAAPGEDPAASATPAPTEPPYSQARSKRKFLLVDKVKSYSNYNVTLRRYDDFDVLSVYFVYNSMLPEGTKLRLVQADTLLDSFGEAVIVPAELENARSDLLCAKIASDRIPLNCASLRMEAVTPEGEVLFTVDYYPDEKGFSADKARKLLNSASEETPAGK